jgi:hypothetical protein
VTQESLTYYDKKDGVAGAAMEIRMMVQASIQNELEVHCKFKNNEVYKLKLGTREETTRWAELLKGLIILNNAESVRSEEKHKNAPAGTFVKADESEVSERISETSPKVTIASLLGLFCHDCSRLCMLVMVLYVSYGVSLCLFHGP